MIRLTGHIDVPPDRQEAVSAALPEHIRLTRAEPGCLRFDVTQSQADPGRFDVSELFTDRAAFDAHQERTNASVWAKITAGIPRSYIVDEVDS